MSRSFTTALRTAQQIRNREITVFDAVNNIVNAYHQTENSLGAYISFDVENALQQCEAVQKRIDKGEILSDLMGVPVAVKDNICTKGLPTTCASKMLKNHIPVYDATVIRKMKEAGMIILGKTNMDEFAMGSTTETSYFGTVRNPYSINRTAGGSSGGSAAAVADGSAYIALGSDTGGSIRQPCSFCNVTGLKPTYGSVSRYGLIAYASSFDQIGPMGKTVTDTAALFGIIRGRDPKDSTSRETPSFSLNDIKADQLQGIKIALPVELSEGIQDSDILKRLDESIRLFRSLGAEISTVSIPEINYAVSAYYTISCAEASSNLSRYDGIRYGYKSDTATNLNDLYIHSRSEGFGEEVKKRIMLGNFVLSSGYYQAYYKKALAAKQIISEKMNDILKTYDFILSPVAPTSAYPIGEYHTDPMKMYLADIYTVPVNLSGLPALALPCGFDGDNMPVGIQLIGRPFDEKTILSAGYAFQQNSDFHLKHPTERTV